MKEQLLPVGTKVFDIRFGWGEIIDNKYNTSCQYLAQYNLDRMASYTSYTYSGSTHKKDINLILSLTEYDLYNGGFTPLSDYNKPKVGDFGYFWDDVNEGSSYLLLSFITDINGDVFYDSKDHGWENFSKEIPDWFLKKMNK